MMYKIGGIFMKNVLEYLEKSALTSSQKIIDESQSCSYHELYIQSQRIGSQIAKIIPCRQAVPLFCQKSVDCLSAFFGSVYAGCFYVLLNPELPANRLQQIVSILESDYVLTDQEHYAQAVEYFKGKTILLIDDLKQGDIDEDVLHSIRQQHLDIDPLYVQFTSGSTGVPKGVVVSHRSVIDFIDYFVELFDFTSDDVIANQAPFDFDVSVKDIYSAMSTGSSLVIVPKKLFSLPTELIDFLCDHNITTMTWAVSALCLISTFHGLDYKVPMTLKKVLFSGEVMPMKHLDYWMSHYPDVTFVNLYGPTEITCNCLYHVIDKKRDYQGRIPVGIPFPNEKVFLLDENNQEVKSDNQVGEICVSGTALALGYYGNSEQTQSHFVQNPLNPHYLETIYRTGDLGFYQEGEIYFSGRKDFQIKYRGHRIELEEIEKAVSEFDGVERGICLFEEQKSQLFVFYVGSLQKKELFTLMKENLPAYMIPSRIIPVEDFPLTKNGKVDRKELMKKGARRHAS